MAGDHIAYFGVFMAGVLTFLSPCILPLIPSFIAYITGVSYRDLTHENKAMRINTVSHTLVFILGFSTVFILLGLTATTLGKMLSAYQNVIRIAGGTLIIIFGITLTGIIKMGFLENSAHFQTHAKKASFLGAFLVGVTFAAAWTPCAGPLLGSILVIASTKGSAFDGAKLLAVYSMGIGIPFLITALAMHTFLVYLKRFEKMMAHVNKVAGVILIIIGILVVTDSLNMVTGRISSLFVK